MRTQGLIRAAAVAVGFSCFAAGPAFADSACTSLSYDQKGLIAQWDGIDNAGRGVHDPNAAYPVELVTNLTQALTGTIPAHDFWFELGSGSLSFVASNVCAAINAGHATIEICISKNDGSVVNNGGVVAFGAMTRGFWVWQSSYLLGNYSYHATVSGQYASINYNDDGVKTVYFALGSSTAASSYGVNGSKKSGITRWSIDMDEGDTCQIGVLPNYNKANAKVFAIRVYDRILSADELAANRAIDYERFVRSQRDVKTIHVSPTGDDVNGDGSKGNPYATLEKGVESCADGDTLLLLKGRYDRSQSAATVTVAKEITIRGETDDPWETVININQGAGPVFNLNNEYAIIKTLAMTNAGGSYAEGSALKITSGCATNCVFWKCNSTGWKFGSAVFANGAKARLVDCVISNCVKTTSNDNSTGGLVLADGARADRCLIAFNEQRDKDGDDASAGGVRILNGHLTNCTIVGNKGKRTGGLTIKEGSVKNCIIAGNESTANTAAYNDVYPGHVSRVTNSASTKESGLDATCVLDLGINFYMNLLTGDIRPAAVPPVTYGYFAVDPTEPKVTMKVDKVKGLVPLVVAFRADVQGFAQGDDIEYAWDFGGGVADRSNEKTASVTFATGTYDVSLTVNNLTTGKTYRDIKPGLVSVVPGTVYVDGTSTSPTSPYDEPGKAAKKLADVLSACGEGTTVRIARGTYDENTTITKSVRIIGDEADPEGVKQKKRWQVTAPGVTIGGVTFTDCNNSFYVTSGDFVISNCVFRNFDVSGGEANSALCVLSAGALVTHCVFTNNYVHASYSEEYRSAGALYLTGGVVCESLFWKNRGKTDATNRSHPGAVALAGGSQMINCTVVDNEALCLKNPVGGVRVVSGSIVNSAIVGNSSGPSGTADCNNVRPEDLQYCSSCVISDDTSVFENFAIAQFGPADDARIFDAGAPRLDAPAKDLAGNDRVQGTAIDIGAYERDPSKFTVSFTADTTEGLSPASFALTASCALPAGETVVCCWHLRNGETERIETRTNNTRLDVTLETCGTWDVSLYVTNETTKAAASAAVAGFLRVCPKTLYVRLGNEQAAYPYDDPAKGAATLADAVDAAGSGSTLHLAPDTYAETLALAKTVTLVGDDACPENVKLTKAVSVTAREVRMSGLTFTDMSTPLKVDSTAPGCTLTNCVVRNCSADNYRSTVNWGGADGLITHCVFTNNTAGTIFQQGNFVPPALYLAGGLVRETLFWNNRVTTEPGGDNVRVAGAATLAGSARMENCTVAGNVGSRVGGVYFFSEARALNTIIAGNTLRDGSASNVLSDQETYCTSCAITSDTSVFEGFAEGKLGPGTSPLVYDAGGERTDVPAKDLAGAPRIQGEAIDVGCYERDPNKFTVSFSSVRTSGLLPATFTLQASCNLPEGDAATYVWTFAKDGASRREVRYDTPSVAVELDELGAWDVSLDVTNTTKGVSASSQVARYLTVGARTLYVKQGNEGALAPYTNEVTAAATIGAAVGALTVDGQEIVVFPGVYTNAAKVEILFGASVRGATGCPEDVLVRTFGFAVRNTGAVLSSLVCEEMSLSDDGVGANIIEGGTVSNCVFRNMSGGSHYQTSPVSATGTRALVTHVVVSNNCSTLANDKTSALGVRLSSGARLENSLICFNTDASTGTGEGSAVIARTAGSAVFNCTIVSNATRGTTVSLDGDSWMRNSVVAGNRIVAGGSGSKTIDVSVAGRVASSALDERPTGVTHLLIGTWEEMFDGRPNKRFLPLFRGLLYDAGDDACVSSATDLRGRRRLVGKHVDIGACEQPATAGFSILVR